MGVSHATNGTLVAAASSLRMLWPSLSAQFVKDTGEPQPRVSFASSGLLTTQIRNGAPFELLLSADLANVKTLQHLDMTREPSKEFALGKLSLVTPSTSRFADNLSLAQLASEIILANKNQASSGNRPFRITLPNPLHAPYGFAAKTALESANAWPVPAGHMLAAENAAQTLQFLNSQAVDIAIVPNALMASSPDSTLTIVGIPDTAYEPVVHAMIRLQTDSPAADKLFNWIQTPQAQKILLEFGLETPVASKEPE